MTTWKNTGTNDAAGKTKQQYTPEPIIGSSIVRPAETKCPGGKKNVYDSFRAYRPGYFRFVRIIDVRRAR